MKNSFAVLSVAVAFSTSLVAKEVTWTGGGSGWADPDNWSDTPQEGDIAVIPENVTATVKSTDIDAFRAFGGYRLDAGSTLFVDAVTFSSTKAFDKPLTGSGTLSAKGGILYIKSDNSAFDGKFAFTNNYVEVHSTSALGTTNEVWLRTQEAKDYNIKIDRVDGPGVVSNCFFFAGTNGRSPAFQGMKSPMMLCGPVTVITGWCKFINDQPSDAYWNRFLGGVFGEGYLLSDGVKGNVTEIFSDVNLGVGGLIASDAGFKINAKILKGTLSFDKVGLGYVFQAANCCCANDLLFSDPYTNVKSGGLFDLNGFDQTIGNIVERLDKNGATTESGCVLTSETSATLTMVGTPNRRYAANGFAGCLTGAISLCYDWDGRASRQAYYTGCTAGLFKLTSENSTSGGITCKRGDFRIEATATLPNLTALGVSNTGKMTVSANGIGEEGDGLVVTVADSGVLTIAEGVTLAAKSACIGGKWIDPKPGETYGGPDSAATVKLAGLAGTGLLTVAEYGGPKGLLLLLK